MKNTADASIYNIPENALYRGLLGTGRLDAHAATLAAAESATIRLRNETISGTRLIHSNYGINLQNGVKLSSNSNVTLKTRKEVVIDGTFEVALGAQLNIDVNPDHNPVCN